jgi:hypothetical protein
MFEIDKRFGITSHQYIMQLESQLAMSLTTRDAVKKGIETPERVAERLGIRNAIAIDTLRRLSSQQKPT